MAHKRGAASLEDIAYIRANSATMTDAQIASAINRSEDFVRKIRAQTPVLVQAAESVDNIDALHAKHWWNELLKSLLDSEVIYFEQSWAALQAQFDDVVVTDELIIRDLIMYDILANRNLRQQKEVLDGNMLYQRLLEEEYAKVIEERDSVVIANLNQQLNSGKAAYVSLQKGYAEIDDRKNKAFQSLKATRDQRFKQLKESKHNFFDLVRELNTREKRASEGRFNELFKLAANKERDKFQQQLDYTGNNDFNIPLLTPELMDAQEKLSEQTLQGLEEGDLLSG